MDRKTNRLLSNNVSSVKFVNVESAKDKFYKQLQKIGLDDQGVERYSLVMNYSNQIDALNLQQLAVTCSYLYNKNEQVTPQDIEYLAFSIVNPQNYPNQEEFRVEYVKIVMTLIRYFYHVIECINRAKGSEDIGDLNFNLTLDNRE